ncbi:MAG: hypothetical protein WAK48_04350 [Candidatus Acidiferrum sp.]
MRRHRFALLTVLVLTSPFLRAQDAQSSPEKHAGTAPRTSAEKYQAHAEQDGLSVGAELLTKKQAADTFAADVNHCCLIVHVAVFPKKGEPIDLSFADFTLVEVKTDAPYRPESPTVIAAKLEKRKSSGGGVDVTETAGVGYESGTYTDPVTGQQVHVRGVSTAAGVGVAAGTPVPPDVADRDREIIERELYEKGLPEDNISIPVSGFLYFPIPKPTKDAKYRLLYSLKDQSLVLALP